MTENCIPNSIDNEEIIYRTLYSPFHYDSKRGKVKPNAVEPPLKKPDDDDPTKANNKVSTIRKKYVSLLFCLEHAHKYEKDNKKFEGFLSLITKDIKNAGADIQAKPVEDNPAHANIVYSMLDLNLQEEVDQLTKAKLKETYTKIANSGKYIKKDIEQNQEFLASDAKE